MENNETHYLTYDPEEIFREMHAAYIENGGDVLYPGDEKEILLRAVQAVMVQAFAGVDNALRMATLRYATGDYLDLYGQKRNCYRLPAKKATGTVEIHFLYADYGSYLPAGTELTADGQMIYILKNDILQTKYEQAVIAAIEAKESGATGNGMTAGTQLQFVLPQSNINYVVCKTDVSGGQDAETDDNYRERILGYGQANMTTGPEEQYIAVVKRVSTEILDTKAINGGGGIVKIPLLLKDSENADIIIAQVEDALNPGTIRPLTDQVNVYAASGIFYALHLVYTAPSGVNLHDKIVAIVDEYVSWQNGVLGRAFNPYRLMAAVYAAGATTVMWGEDSEFDDGPVEYAEIDPDAYCSGKVIIEV